MKRIISVIFKHLALCNRFTHVPTSLLPLQVLTLISQYTASVYCFYSDYSGFYIFCKLKRQPVSLPYLTDILKRDTLTVIQHTRQYFLTGGSHFHEIKKTSLIQPPQIREPSERAYCHRLPLCSQPVWFVSLPVSAAAKVS